MASAVAEVWRSGQRRGCSSQTGEAQFAHGALCQEAVGELKRAGSAASREDRSLRWISQAGKREQTGGVVEREATAKPACGGAEHAAAERGRERMQAIKLDREHCRARGSGIGATATTDRLARQHQLRKQAVEFALPELLLVACDLGEIAEGGVQRRIEAAKRRQELVAKAIAGVCARSALVSSVHHGWPSARR